MKILEDTRRITYICYNMPDACIYIYNNVYVMHM